MAKLRYIYCRDMQEILRKLLPKITFSKIMAMRDIMLFVALNVIVAIIFLNSPGK